MVEDAGDVCDAPGEAGEGAARDLPSDLAGELRRSSQRARALLIYAAVLSTATFLGVCVLLWRWAEGSL